MAPLYHIAKGVEKTAAEIWARRGSVSTATAIGPLLREAEWITLQANIHAYINRIPGVENIETYAASRLTHLLVHTFIQSFNTSFPHPTPWRLSLLAYRVTPRLHTMKLTKKSSKASPLLDYAKTTRRGNSATTSAHVCASQPISEASGTRYTSYKYLLTRSARAYLRPTTSP